MQVSTYALQMTASMAAITIIIGETLAPQPDASFMGPLSELMEAFGDVTY